MNLTIAGSNHAPKYYIDNKAIFNFGLGQATGLTYTVYFNNISDGRTMLLDVFAAASQIEVDDDE